MNTPQTIFADPRSPAAEAYRLTRTSISFSSVDHYLSSLLITSPGPGEGKSTSTANLAVAFAQEGRNVLIIDGDLRRPVQHKIFGLPNIQGLTNVLVTGRSLQEAVQETSEPRLHLLTSGPLPPNPAELVGSNSLKRLLQEAKSSYDLVILDSPPVTMVTDATILASFLDGTILIISANQTTRDMAQKAKKLLTGVNAKILGVILNKVSSNSRDYYYYYQYKYEDSGNKKA